MAVALIFASNTHYLFIQAIIDSYSKFPVGELMGSDDLSQFVTHIVTSSFILSFKLAAPFIAISLIILVGTGLLARIMPNLQVFFVITPVQILAIFGAIYITLIALIDKMILTIGAAADFQYF